MKKIKNSLKLKLQIRFVLLAVAAMLVLQTMIIGFSAIRSYRLLTQRTDQMIMVVGSDPNSSEYPDAQYFIVFYDSASDAVRVNTLHASRLTGTQIEQFARQAFYSRKNKGFLHGYRYLVQREETAARIIFFSRKTGLRAWRHNAGELIYISLGGIVMMTVFLSAVSGQVVSPLVKNRQKQKEFITSASHGLKTPLTVIQADAQLLEADFGENEWLTDILKQTSYMTEMMNRLVYLARAEEQDDNTVKIEFPVSDVAEELTDSYQSVAHGSGKHFAAEIQPGISYRGDEKAIRELMTILLDNAFKYSTEEGNITVRLSAEGKGVRFAVENSVSSIDPQQLENFSERFYRADASGKVKGFGIGLSIAKAVAESHKGKLTAELPEAGRIRITALLKQ